MTESTVEKEHDFNKPDIHQMDCLLEDIIKDCRNRYFYKFDYRLVYDIKYKNISKNQEVVFTNTHRPMEFKTQFYGLNIKS